MTKPKPRKWPKVDPATIAPLNYNGNPDLHNYMPSRFVTQEEAVAQGWTMFYVGTTCRYGHQAPRYTSNKDICIDCKRIKDGKQPIGTKAGGSPEDPTPIKRAYEKSAGREAEPDRVEKMFLVSYAAVKDIDLAAAECRLSPAQVHMRLSTSKAFREATNDLEERLGIKRTVPDPVEYQWTEDARSRLITIYIDTGLMATARDAIGVTPSEFYKEVERNASFAEKLDLAKPLAMISFEETAQQLAKNGNDKLLSQVLKAERPDKYSERVKVDMNVTEKLTEEQLNAQLKRLFEAARSRAASVAVIEPSRALEGPGSSDGDEPQSEPESYRDLL